MAELNFALVGISLVQDLEHKIFVLEHLVPPTKWGLC